MNQKLWNDEQMEAEITLAIKALAECWEAAYQSYCILKKEVTQSPGCIVYKGPGKRYAYWQFYKGGKHVQRYIRPAELEKTYQEIEKLKQLQQRKRNLRYHLRALTRCFRYFGLDAEAVMEERRKEVEVHTTRKNQRKEALRRAQFEMYPESHRHVTDRMEVVASKSELIIANEMIRQGIHYDYEKRLYLPDGVIRPDFTLYLPDGTEIYWEHAGMMDDPEYARNFRNKLMRYDQAGYHLNEQLIVTYDRGGTIDLEIVRRFLISLYMI